MNLVRLAIGCTGMLAALTVSACSSAVAHEDVGVGSAELEVCASTTTLDGVDVSHHNGDIGWAKVKASGRVYAFARVSDGIKTPDTKFAKNWPAIKAAGLVRGAYQFFRPSRDGVQQADLMLKKIAENGGLKAGDLPPVLDLETTDDQSAAIVVSSAKKWIARIESKLGIKPIVYTGNHMSPTIGTNFEAYALWVPHYGVPCPRVPAGWSTWTFWQDSETGAVPGVPGGGIDTDFFNGDRKALDALTIKRTPTIDVASLTADADFDTSSELSAGEDAVMGDSSRGLAR